MSNLKSSGDPIDPRLVRKLADILKETELSEIEVERGDLKIRVAKAVTVVAAPAVHPVAHAPYAPVAAPAQAHAPALAPVAVEAAPAAPARGEQVKSPMVGTVYLQPSPGSDPFIKVGDRVKAGQTLLIVEAMKTMNPIAAPKDGEVVEILVNDAQPVEYGVPLIILA